MRTLKKSLALVLVLAMMFSLCITASAYTDDEKIEYADAVELLSALKVIEGYPDGSFQPAKTLNRAEAAVIIAKLNGYFDEAATTPSYTDMAGYSWANAAVAYCENEGIVNGTAAGIYEPGTTLTGYMFVKMLAVSMGIDADEAGMTGPAWQIGITKVNKELNLTAGIEDFDMAAAITREEAAQLAFNALLYARDGYTWVVGHNGHDHFFTNENDALAFYIATKDAAKPVSGEFKCSLGYEVFGLIGLADGFDKWGHPFYGWYSDRGVFGTWYTKHAYAPVASWTTPVAESTIFDVVAPINGVKEYANTEDYTWVDSYWVDGVEHEEIYTYDKGGKWVDNCTGYGVETYIYDTMFSGVVMVHINEYIGKVVNVEVANSVTGADRVVDIENYCELDDDEHYFYQVKSETLNKGDVILYNICKGEIEVIGAPKTITGTVVKVEAGNGTIVYTIGDEAKILSKHSDCDIFLADTATWYLDSHGYLMMKAADVKLDYKVGYLLAVDAQSPYTGDKMHEETYEASIAYTLYDAQDGIITLNGDVYVDAKAGTTYFPGIGMVANKDAFSADVYDIAYGTGVYNAVSTKEGVAPAGLTTGLVLYLVDENGDIYWMSDKASIDGVLKINVSSGNLTVYSDTVKLNGHNNKLTTDKTEFYYAGATVQTIGMAAVGYANATKDVAMPGEYIRNIVTNEIIAVSQHADPEPEKAVTGYLYVSEKFHGDPVVTAEYNKYTGEYKYTSTVTYTGLYLDGKEISLVLVNEAPLMLAPGLYTVDVYSTGLDLDTLLKLDAINAKVSDVADDGSYIIAGGEDYVLNTKGVSYVQLGNHAAVAVEAMPETSVQYDIYLYYINEDCSVVYFYTEQ